MPERNDIKSLNLVICSKRTLQIMHIFFISSSPKELIYTLLCTGKMLSEILIPCNWIIIQTHQNSLDQGKSSQTGRRWTADVLSTSSDYTSVTLIYTFIPPQGFSFSQSRASVDFGCWQKGIWWLPLFTIHQPPACQDAKFWIQCFTTILVLTSKRALS